VTAAVFKVPSYGRPSYGSNRLHYGSSSFACLLCKETYKEQEKPS